MSVLFLVDREQAVIDSYQPQTDETSPVVTQADNPGENPQGGPVAHLSGLPDPAVGGVKASGILNGFSTGFRSLFTRQQPFTGAVASPPAITNPVQGNVGQSNRAAQLYAGVMNQLVQYTPSQASYVAAYVGNIPTRDAK